MFIIIGIKNGLKAKHLIARLRKEDYAKGGKAPNPAEIGNEPAMLPSLPSIPCR